MIEGLLIRPEREHDFDEIRSIVKTAFAGAEHSDGDEHNLIDRLRCSDEYIPELSLIAEANGKIVGYAMFSLINIGIARAVALAPLAVLPGFQSLGIGRELIEAGHRKAKEDYLLVLCRPWSSRVLLKKRLSSGITIWDNSTL